MGIKLTPRSRNHVIAIKLKHLDSLVNGESNSHNNVVPPMGEPTCSYTIINVFLSYKNHNRNRTFFLLSTKDYIHTQKKHLI